jgi:Fe-Mn family superoxide dismutase
MEHKLPKLPYSYNALEPYFDAQTMETHYLKHHQAYINKLNEALKIYPALQKKTIEELLQSLDKVPNEIWQVVRNNGGGHFNHSFFWQTIGPPKNNKPKGKLALAINRQFGSFIKFQEEFSKVAVSFFGSGWAWLLVNAQGKLEIATLPNHESPEMNGFRSILVLDLWEHAYYLKYQNRRVDYIKAWWSVINWEAAENNFNKN